MDRERPRFGEAATEREVGASGRGTSAGTGEKEYKHMGINMQ